MRHYILYNPLAGNKNKEEHLATLKIKLDGECVFCDVTKIDNYKNFFFALKPSDKIIICGGDGTLNRFINETAELGLPNDIYYYASGSGNDFLHDIPGKSADEPFLINEYIKELPTVEVKGKTYRFLNGVGYGIDGYCCEEGDKKKELSDKAVNYTAIAIKGLLFDYKPTNATITVDGVSHEFHKVWLAPTMNGRFYGGGMMIAPDQDRLNREHTVSVGIFHDAGKIKTLMIFPSIFKGEHVSHDKYFTTFKGHEITVRFDRPVALQIDGETIRNVSEYTVKSFVPAKL